MTSKDWAGVSGMVFGFAAGVLMSRDVVRSLRRLADLIDHYHGTNWSSRRAS
ncbi:MAG TPA: hypothetical protein VMV23_09350 [Candidatus Nanopelagicaceae bacterium]|nr:hypothetical protein [Candidatus Nanopelagicaceae bacterium]